MAANDGEPMLPTASEQEENDEGWLELQSNVYSAGIAGLIKEMAYTPHDNPEKEADRSRMRRFRLLTSLLVILLAIGLQVFLVTKVKTLVCAKSVHFIREMYGEYQESMYSRTTLTVNGYARGVDGFFQIENFDDLEEEFKQNVCQIPLSQPDFLGVVLLIWTMSVLAEIRKCYMWAMRFLWVTPTMTDWSQMIQKSDGEDGLGLEAGLVAVKGISAGVKVAIGILFFIQASTAFYLLWVGCRWLTATPSFSDLILNGLALTFIVEIKDMLYEDLLPRLFQEETETVRIKREKLPMAWRALAVPVVLLGLSSLWVYAYMYHLQAVLPDYRWDVRSTCANFLGTMLST